MQHSPGTPVPTQTTRPPISPGITSTRSEPRPSQGCVQSLTCLTFSGLFWGRSGLGLAFPRPEPDIPCILRLVLGKVRLRIWLHTALDICHRCRDPARQRCPKCPFWPVRVLAHLRGLPPGGGGRYRAGVSANPTMSHTLFPASLSSRRSRLQISRRWFSDLFCRGKGVVKVLAWRHHVTPGVAGIWAIQDRANQVPYHGPYQEPIK